MTAEIVNLRRFKKAKERATKEAQAQANRARTGRAKAERVTTAAEQERHGRQLDGARLTPNGSEDAASSAETSPRDEDMLDPGNVS